MPRALLIPAIVFLGAAASRASAQELPADEKGVDAVLTRLSEAREFAPYEACLSPRGRRRLRDLAGKVLREAFDDASRREKLAEDLGLLPNEVFRRSTHDLLESDFRDSSRARFPWIRGDEFRVSKVWRRSDCTVTLLRSIPWRRIELDVSRADGPWQVESARFVPEAELFDSPEKAAREWCAGLARGEALRAALAASLGFQKRLCPEADPRLPLLSAAIRSMGVWLAAREALRQRIKSRAVFSKEHAKAADGTWVIREKSASLRELTSRAAPGLRIVCFRRRGVWRVSSDSLLAADPSK